MTITVGFLCSDGVVLGADSQESLDGGLVKRSVPKLIVAPPIPTTFEKLQKKHQPDRRAVFTGAGDGPLIDKLVAEVWTDITMAAPSVGDMATAAEDAIVGLYKKLRGAYHAGYSPSAELLYGLWCNGNSGLFHAYGPIVNEVGQYFGQAMVGYKSAGTGSELTDYIAKRMYNQNFKVSEAALLAIYMLQQAIEHAEGCGGDIHLAVLRNNGEAENLEASKSITSHFMADLDSNLGALMIAAADADYKEGLLDLLWSRIRTYIIQYRKSRQDIASAEAQHKEEMSKLLEDIRSAAKKFKS